MWKIYTIAAQSPFYRLAAVALLTQSTILSVDGSFRSASTNQTATFGYSMSDNAEEVPAALARGLAMKNDPERLGTPIPKERKIRRLPLGVLDLLY